MSRVYHATPLDFSCLSKGSWVSDSLMEACLHLLLKNLEAKETDRLYGYVITIPDFDDSCIVDSVELGGVTNYVTDHPISFDPTNQRQTFKQAISSLPENGQWLFFAEDIVDLKPFLSI